MCGFTTDVRSNFTVSVAGKLNVLDLPTGRGPRIASNDVSRKAKGMPNDLTELEIDEVSFVRKGANPRARIVLHKADTQRGAEHTPPKSWHFSEVRKDFVVKISDIAPEVYDQAYGVAKADAKILDGKVIQLLAVHQQQAAQRREAALVDSTVSLYRRLDDPELAEAYDGIYGRPVDEDARATMQRRTY